MDKKVNNKKIINKILAVTFVLTVLGTISGCTRKEEKIFFRVSKDTVSVYGYVKDYTGNPIPDAEITVLPTGDKIKSEKDGLYKFSIGLGELPQDAVITYAVKKDGFVTSRVSISFSEILTGPNNDFAIQKRVKRQDVVLFPPAEIEVEVVDKDNKPVAGSRVLVLPSPQIALYLGVSQNEAVASVTSQTNPVKITGVIPAIDFVTLAAFPPEGSEEDYNISAVFVDVVQIKSKGKVVLQLKPLEIVYSSVAVGQYISPDANIKLIFSKEITGIETSLTCGGDIINISTKISGAEVEIDPAGRIFGNCQLQVNNAFGKKGETLTGPSLYSFVAYDPNAPRGLACPILTPFLPTPVTAVSFDQVLANPRAIYYSPDPGSFDGFNRIPDNRLILLWDPPVVRGIKEFKLKYIKLSDKLKGSEKWEEINNVGINFSLNENKWTAVLDFGLSPLSGFDISFGEKYYIAAVPVNLNGEEICNPETIDNPFTIQDNTSPRITGCGISFGSPSYTPGDRILEIQFSENITFASATINSRNFDAIKIQENFDILNQNFTIQIYLEPLSAKIPVDSENSNGDGKLLLPNDEAKKLWVGERVDVTDASGNTVASTQITAIVGGLANSTVWFSSNILWDVGNGAVVPRAVPNFLQAPNYRQLYVLDSAQKRLDVSDSTGLTIDDKIQVVDKYSNTRKILTIKSVDWNNDIITVDEDISDLKCNSASKFCRFRSFRPDVWVKVQAYDTSGNLIDSLADQCSVGPLPPVIW